MFRAFAGSLLIGAASRETPTPAFGLNVSLASQPPPAALATATITQARSRRRTVTPSPFAAERRRSAAGSRGRGAEPREAVRRVAGLLQRRVRRRTPAWTETDNPTEEKLPTSRPLLRHRAGGPAGGLLRCPFCGLLHRLSHVHRLRPRVPRLINA